MKKTIWYYLVLEGYKGQYFPEELRSAMELKYGTRAAIPVRGADHYKEVSELYIDYGGMCSVDMVDMKIEFDGGVMEVPARDVDMLLVDLKNLEAKEDLPPYEYYKVYSKWTCTCLLPGHRESLMAELREKSDEASAIADKELEDLKKKIDAVNKKAGRQS